MSDLGYLACKACCEYVSEFGCGDEITFRSEFVQAGGVISKARFIQGHFHEVRKTDRSLGRDAVANALQENLAVLLELSRGFGQDVRRHVVGHRKGRNSGRNCVGAQAYMSSNLTALVTGAAARIGAAIARRLHQRGCNVVVHYNANTDGAAALAEQLNSDRPESATLATADLSQLEGVRSLAAQVIEASAAWGSALNVLVNNASRFYPTPLAQTQAWEWDDLLNSNLRGPYFLVQQLLEPLSAGNGCIVNILDIHSERPLRGHPAYCISKAGLRMMTLSLASELAPAVRVNGVAPGAILWPERELSRSARDEIMGKIALGRLGEPDDIASAVAYLALDAPYVTGEILNVDGGRSLSM